ncbi:MAG: DNA mismatch repair endonuclease MutL [Oscillospiraceae bacterium]|nr:DNA mismatch repair endonuclease MutL [Oscillospiraceae bacterium]
MPKIHVLSKHIANLIAAGEVVERPASVAKELVENALDAGASAITVELQNGGISYLRVMDNGHGIAKADVKNAFARHSTSKIRSEEDLAHITTLGFRGEALAAIASVSKIDLFTKSVDEEIGSSLHLEGGEIISHEDAGVPDGTTVIVRDLFFNTPARMKFLRKNTSEAASVEQVVLAAALSHPTVSFRLIRDGKNTLHTSGDGNLKNCIFSALGSHFSSDLIEAKSVHDTVRVYGYTCKPVAARGNRTMQYFFINGRIVKSKLLSAALDEAYRDLLMKGKFPACVLFFELSPELVDVNVHPAKTEVKFAHDRQMFEATYFAVKTALQNDRGHVAAEPRIAPTVIRKEPEKVPEPVREIPKPSAPVTSIQQSFQMPRQSIHREVESQPIVLRDDSEGILVPPKFVEPPVVENPTAPVVDRVVSESKEEEVTPIKEEVVPEHRVIGELFATYLIVECENEVLFIDKHAAHERVLFEKIKREFGAIDAQVLLSAIPVTLSKPEQTALLQAEAELRKFGFAVEELGETSLAVCEAPAALDLDDVPQVIGEIAESLLQGNRLSQPEQVSELLHSIACKMAIKAGKRSADAEIHHLVDRVLRDPDIRYCPHGRPVSITMTRAQFEKMFKRTL